MSLLEEEGMVAYGRRKRRGSTIHPADDEPSKSHERFVARQEAIFMAEDDMMVFGTGVVLVTAGGVEHVPLKDILVVIPPVGT